LRVLIGPRDGAGIERRKEAQKAQETVAVRGLPQVKIDVGIPKFVEWFLQLR